MEEDIQQEKYIKTSPEPVSLEGTEKILSQMKNSICKIHKLNGSNATGFFCKIKYFNKQNLLPVLITNNHVLNEDDIADKKNVCITINNEKENKSIYIDESRKKYTSSKFDITIIEIKIKEDNIDINNFLEIDETIYKNRLFVETALINKSIYIIHYPKGKNVKVSYGLLSNIIDNDINHLCCTEEGSSGAPIISLETNKVIGIHIGCTNNNFKFNKGKFIKYSINSFIYHNKIKDEVENIREIYIIPKDKGGSIIPLDVKSSDTLKNIKERFLKKSGIKKYVNFFFEKKECDYKTLFDYKIRNESFLEFEGSGIFVKTLPDKVYKIYIDNEKTVKDLKKEIEERLDFPINNQRLIFVGKELEDNRTLLDYKIYDESTVILGMKLNNEENYKEEKKNELQKNVNKKEKEKNIINLFIKNQNGHSFNLISESNNNIKDIKFQITKKYLESKTLVSPNQQILFFNGKILEDNETLSYYNIKNKSMISLKINMNIFVE